MLNLAVRNTNKLIREKSASQNIRLGRLFTKKDTARLMAGMLNLDDKKTIYTILDPGAGTGILAAAAIEEVCKRCPQSKQIFITCYENDPVFIPMLKNNLERIRKKCRHDYGVKLYSTVYEENYLTDSKNHYTVALFDEIHEDKFDIIIANPPLDLIDKHSPEAEAVGGVTQLKIGAPYLFCRLAAKHLEENGQLVIVLPTLSATSSGLSTFRKEMADSLALRKIHLFVGKQKNLKRAIPLKKSFILAYENGERGETIDITTSTDNGVKITALPPVAYDFIVDKEDGTLTLPKSVEDTKIVKHISDQPETLTSLGLKMSTGLIIDSRCEGMLFTEPIKGCVPLIRPSAIKGGQIRFPQPVKRQYISPTSERLVQRNKNMIFIKRVPAKSDERFVNAAIYMASQLGNYRYISTHNKINFIDTVDKNVEMNPRFVFGLFALLNSTIYDRYISIMSKSKQINSKEMRDLPLPPRNIIENIGMRLMATRQTTVAVCDQIVNPTLHIIEKKR
ncbi:MAG: SAM-dependent DNA methyltransferase [Clostridia bacterium]|nr:SAM-dependent DNA methyltransferase [Clostridia bacterium]